MEAISSLFGFIFGLIKLAIFLAIVLAGVAFWGYNTLRRLSENVKAAWSNIGVMTAKLVAEGNQLGEIAKTVQASEQFTYLKMSEDMSVAALASVQSQSAAMMANLSQLAQRYPELASNKNFIMNMESAKQSHAQVAVIRQVYNDAAKEYNLARTSIPHVFYSSMLGFREAPYLDPSALKAGDAADRPLIINDDGERLNAMLRSGGAAAAVGARQITTQAKALLDKGVAKTASAPAAGAPVSLPAPAPAKEHEYLYLDGADAKGPVTLSGLAALRGAGVIRPETKVFHPVEQRWAEYREIAGD
jgi:LemA protein